MPQLDTFTYLSQLFWVFVLFSGFYVLVLSDILPSFSQILKTRKKKLDQNGDNIENLFKEESEAYSQYEDNVVLSLEESREMLAKKKSKSGLWLDDQVTLLNSSTSTSMNGFLNKYLSSVFSRQSQLQLVVKN
jgi:hypothetical protein